jgi:phage protein D
MARFPAYAPEFRLRINGEELPAAVRSTVTSVRYQDGEKAADRVEVGFANPDLRWLQTHIKGLGFRPFPTGVKIGPVRAAEAAPEGTFDVDNPLDLALGYAPDSLEEVFEGNVTGVSVTFPNGGMPTLSLVAHDRLQRLAEGKRSRSFGFIPDAIVAAILGAENLLIPAVEPTILAASALKFALGIIPAGPGGLRQDETDLELLDRIALQYDASYWVEGDVLYLSRFLKEYEPRLTLTWGQSLLDFSPRMSTVGQVASASMRFTLREIPLTFAVSVFWDFDRESVGVLITPGGSAPTGFAGPDDMTIDRPIRTPLDVAANALQIYTRLRQKLNNRVTGSGSAIGDPRIRAGAVIRLEGLGPDFSGDYRVSSATHTLDSGGYKTSFEVFKEILP